MIHSLYLRSFLSVSKLNTTTPPQPVINNTQNLMSSLTQRLEEVIRDRHHRRLLRRDRRDQSEDDDDDPILFSGGGERRRRRGRPPPPPVKDDDDGDDNDDDNDDDDDDDDDGGNLTYGECLDMISEHERWLVDTIRHQLSPTDLRPRRRDDGGGPQDAVEDVDVVVGYLSDNSPDLLLSVLACAGLALPSKASSIIATKTTKVTTRTTTGPRLLPAMIHCRWTPAEVERALRPHNDGEDDNEDDDEDDGGGGGASGV